MPTSAFPPRTSRMEVYPRQQLISLEKDLPAAEVDQRLVALARVHRRVEAALCFYLHEVEERRLYLRFGHASTIDYARERLGFEDRKTRTFLFVAERCATLPRIAEALRRGELPWTKAREVIRVAQPETEQEWLSKCQTLSNRQLETEVHNTLPPVKEKALVMVLEGEETWEQTREAMERLTGKSLANIEVFDVMCAEVLCAYALTPPHGAGHGEIEDRNDSDLEELRRRVLERDSWKCTRPGCLCRSGLEVNHIIPRSRSGPHKEWNLHVVCAVCHAAITSGRITVKGRAPHGLTWTGPFGVIEKPLQFMPISA